MKKFLSALILIFILTLSYSFCMGLELSKGVPHYAQEMEFYYIKPRPEILPLLFQNFYTNGVLANSENRLMLASFLAELARGGKLDLENFIKLNKALGKDAKHTLAWAVHLSGASNEDRLLDEVLEAKETYLLNQIKNTPNLLLNWSLDTEKSVLKMYWAAFMARGNLNYVDAIIKSALNCAQSVNSSTKKRDTYDARLAAAASLYDLVSTHDTVKERVEATLKNKSGEEKKILKMILREKNS